MRIEKLNKTEMPWNVTAAEQVLLNRGIPYQDIKKYYRAYSEENINPPTAFRKDLLIQGINALFTHIGNGDYAFIIVDSDVDGFASAAIMINYLHDRYETWTETKLHWGFHDGKQHGLNDYIDVLENSQYKLIICPDSASNDLDEIERLHNKGIDVLILDHHLCDEFSPYAITINSQYDYPNPELSGAGVVWQFCRAIDKLDNSAYAEKYYDLVALALQSDMMNTTSLETKELIFKGFREEYIKNPFISEMIEKQHFSLHKSDYEPSYRNGLVISPIGCSFFITPFVNAINRSGTLEEKELIFESMLNHRAYKKVLSTKRGHKLGEEERIVDQALRTCTNVKNRQTKAEEAGLEFFDQKIKREGLL